MKPVVTFCVENDFLLLLHGFQLRPFTVDFAFRGGGDVIYLDRVLCLLAAANKPELNQLLMQRGAHLSDGQLDEKTLVAFLNSLGYEGAALNFNNVVSNHSIVRSQGNGLLVKVSGRYALGQYVVKIEELDNGATKCLYHPDISATDLMSWDSN